VFLIGFSVVALASIAPAQEQKDRTRTVRITAADGTGVPGVPIRAAGSDSWAQTGIDGVATIESDADHELAISCAGDLTRILAGDERREFVAGGLPELVVTALRADDGTVIRPASGALAITRALTAPLAFDPESGVMRRSAVAVEWNPRSFRRTERISVVMRDREADLVGSAWVDLETRVSALVRRIEVVVPVRRLCRIRMRVIDTDGAPVEGAQVNSVEWADSFAFDLPRPPHVQRAASDGDGVLEVDIPHFANDLIVVNVIRGSLWEDHSEGRSAPIPLRPGITEGSEIRMGHAEPIEEGPGVGGGYGRGGFPEEREPESPATLVVRALDSTGHPLARAALMVDDGRSHYEVADRTGTARFTGLEAGRVTIRFADRAIRPRAVFADVRSEDEVAAVLAEPAGRDLDVVVVHADKDASPVAFARVECHVGEVEFRPVIDGAWRSRLTDAAGRLRIPDAPRGPIAIRVIYGSRQVTVELEPDDDGSIRVTLPPGER